MKVRIAAEVVNERGEVIPVELFIDIEMWESVRASHAGHLRHITAHPVVGEPFTFIAPEAFIR